MSKTLHFVGYIPCLWICTYVLFMKHSVFQFFEIKCPFPKSKNIFFPFFSDFVTSAVIFRPYFINNPLFKNKKRPLNRFDRWACNFILLNFQTILSLLFVISIKFLIEWYITWLLLKNFINSLIFCPQGHFFTNWWCPNEGK